MTNEEKFEEILAGTLEKTNLAKNRLDDVKWLIEEIEDNPKDFWRNRTRIRHIISDLWSVLSILETEFEGNEEAIEWIREKKEYLSGETELGNLLRFKRHTTEKEGKRIIFPFVLYSGHPDKEETEIVWANFFLLSNKNREDTELTKRPILHLCKKYYVEVEDIVEESYEKFSEEKREELADKRAEEIKNLHEKNAEEGISIM